MEAQIAYAGVKRIKLAAQRLQPLSRLRYKYNSL